MSLSFFFRFTDVYEKQQLTKPSLGTSSYFGVCGCMLIRGLYRNTQDIYRQPVRLHDLLVVIDSGIIWLPLFRFVALPQETFKSLVELLLHLTVPSHSDPDMMSITTHTNEAPQASFPYGPFRVVRTLGESVYAKAVTAQDPPFPGGGGIAMGK
ncbi:hypothetical protein EDD22DRAFT_846724 [Suillus occidentalis]|nr:hypothetical protein EDD22DRAFT_846724 [Suillus occidentalis]